MRFISLNFLLGTFCVLPATLLFSSNVRAQAVSTASRSSDIAVFGGFAGAKTDYGINKDKGVAFGVDFTRFFRHIPIVPSLEVRATIVHGSIVNQQTYLAGGRAELPLRRLHPYVDVLVGLGTLHYVSAPAPGYTSDRSAVLSYGGGIDVSLVYNFQLKVDAQYQTWNLGPFDPSVPQEGDFTLTPIVGTLGVEYHIPFRPRSRQRDFYH